VYRFEERMRNVRGSVVGPGFSEFLFEFRFSFEKLLSDRFSLSRAGIRRLVGCRLPDAILLASEVFGLIAGPSSALWSLKY
jgi:hypothetical protein